jgi:predicted metal-dependent hydrolase
VTAPAIRARRAHIDLSATPLHWIPDDPQSTHTANVLHLLLPPGERWFCDVFRDALPLVTDRQLRDDVRGFIAQEATHAKAHDLGLDQMAAHGVDARPRVAAADRARRALRRRVRGLPMPVFRRVLLAELAAIAAVEHITATLGRWIVEHDSIDQAGGDEAMLALLRWHGAEEVEHRSVAFDLYEHLSGNYTRRALSMGIVGPALTLGWAALTDRLMAADPTTEDRWSWRRHFAAARAGRTLSLVAVVRSFPAYVRPGHHPSKAGGYDAAIAYLTR